MFQRIADWISEFIGTPFNIIVWILVVIIWVALFALHILNASSNVLPSWFTSNAFNFPLNTVTTLIELYVGFFCAAAANRLEKRNYQLHQIMIDLLNKEEVEIQSILQHENDLTSSNEG